ncbi:hypothetical protein VTO7225_02038 [Vibrio toranzoniae]|nr:hypothetical protein VTO7225_02038 [Vibrio toranzoniae]
MEISLNREQPKEHSYPNRALPTLMVFVDKLYR